jgi:hypothetical protein
VSFTYRQRTGELLRDGELVGVGYSGLDDGDGVAEPGEGRNDPAAQGVRNVGPIPAGRYVIGPAFTHPTKGGLVMGLAPLPGTDTLGRSGFLIHGDSRRAPGTASQGCIVLERDLRLLVSDCVADGDDELEVVADAPGEPLAAAPVPSAFPVTRTGEPA